MARQSNLAYDLTMFDEGARKRAQAQRRAEVTVVRTKETKAHPASPFKGLFVACFAIGVCSIMLYSQVQNNELHNQIMTQAAYLEDLQSENIQMQNELDARMSLQNVEEYATDVLGLQKIENSQVEYVSLDMDSVVVVDNQEQDNFFTSVRDNFVDMLEYIGF